MIQLHQKAILEQVGDEGFALHMSTGVYYELNKTANEMLSALIAGDDRSVVVERTAERYRVDREQVNADLEALLVDLRKYQLIV